ncbi:MAG: hypothetical protein WKG01_09820 [Kofleriaceae bacterium]
MPRLGELLVAAGLLTPEQIEQALRAQVMWGGRLGTNLIELGYLDLDTLSKTLGRQHRLPAALARHFDKGDRTLQTKLSPDVAERYSCIPLLWLAHHHQVAIAAVAPIDARGVAIIADELALAPEAIVISIAAELRIRYHLERVYQIPRSTRFLRSRGKTVPPFPQFQILPVEELDPEVELPPSRSAAQPIEVSEEPVDLSALAVLEEDEPDPSDDLVIEHDPEPPPPSGRDRRAYIRTIADAHGTESERQLGRIAIRRIAITNVVSGPGNTLGEATRAIRRSTDRDRVADLVIDAIGRFLPGCEAAILLVVRGAVAIGWKGYARAGHALPEIAVPLEQPGLVPRVVQRAQTQRSPTGDLGEIDRLLLGSLAQSDGERDGELVVAPVTIGSQVMCVLALVATPETPSTAIEQIAAATGAAFARLMRNASR